ncbi:hypothetical protein D3C81_2147560 [compost metagenome]
MRQVAHFAGDDCKAASLFAGARCFDCRIQCQDIGLEGDAVDDAYDVGDFLCRAIDAVHRDDHFTDDLAAFDGDF